MKRSVTGFLFGGILGTALGIFILAYRRHHRIERLLRRR